LRIAKPLLIPRSLWITVRALIAAAWLLLRSAMGLLLGPALVTLWATMARMLDALGGRRQWLGGHGRLIGGNSRVISTRPKIRHPRATRTEAAWPKLLATAALGKAHAALGRGADHCRAHAYAWRPGDKRGAAGGTRFG